MDEVTRKQAADELARLRAQVEAGSDTRDAELVAHIDELHALLTASPARAQTHTLARSLEQRLLAWEAEHPRLVALASRVAHALEDSGL